MKEKTLGQYLRDLRKRKKMTTRQVGSEIGYSYSYIASLETEKRTPSDEVLEKYIYSLASNGQELNKIKYEIANLTNGTYYKNYLKQGNEYFVKDNKINSMNIEEDSLISEKIYDFPINDISFHLKDKYNTKYFEGFKLDDNDRNNIHTTICIHIKSKIENELIKTIDKINLELEKFALIKKRYSSANTELKNAENDNEKIKSEIKVEVFGEKLKEISDQLEFLHNEENNLQGSLNKIENIISNSRRGV